MHTHTPQATADTQEELWAGLPSSNVFKQKKLTGSAESSDPSADAAGVECRTFVLEAERYAELLRFLGTSGLDLNAVMLGACHVALQWILDDVESLIGSCVVVPGTRSATLRASYVYSEDDDAVEAFLADVDRQWRSGRATQVTPAESSWDTRRAPAFFYAGLDGMGALDAAVADLQALRVRERRVLVVVAAQPERVEVMISMPSAAAEAIGIDAFRGRYEVVLDSLSTGACSRVGELKARLGAASDVPYRQLEEMQRRVIALWAKVLGISDSDLTESSSYFEVGGTSLNAFKLVNRVRTEFQRDISIRDLIDNPTIRDFARLLLKD